MSDVIYFLQSLVVDGVVDMLTIALRCDNTSMTQDPEMSRRDRLFKSKTYKNICHRDLVFSIDELEHLLTKFVVERPQYRSGFFHITVINDKCHGYRFCFRYPNAKTLQSQLYIVR